MLRKFCHPTLRKELWTRSLLLKHTLSLACKENKSDYFHMKRQLDAHEYYIWNRYGFPPFFVSTSQWIEKIENTAEWLHHPKKKFLITSEGNIHSIQTGKIVFPWRKKSRRKIKFPLQIARETSFCICSLSNARYLQSLIKRIA